MCDLAAESWGTWASVFFSLTHLTHFFLGGCVRLCQEEKNWFVSGCVRDKKKRRRLKKLSYQAPQAKKKKTQNRFFLSEFLQSFCLQLLSAAGEICRPKTSAAGEKKFRLPEMPNFLVCVRLCQGPEKSSCVRLCQEAKKQLCQVVSGKKKTLTWAGL